MGHPGLFMLMRRAALPALCLLVSGYFAIHAFTGPSGLRALGGIRADHARNAAEHARLLDERAALERRVALLDPRGADPDLADELVRRELGVVRPDELVVPLCDSAARGCP